MHGIGRWLVLAAFVGIGHALAFAGQVDMVAGDQAMPMLDCLPCATCYVGPASTASRLEAATTRTALPPPPG